MWTSMIKVTSNRAARMREFLTDSPWLSWLCWLNLMMLETREGSLSVAAAAVRIVSKLSPEKETH